MKLIEPTAEYGRQIQAYRQEFLNCGDSMDGTDGLRRMEDAGKWAEHCRYMKDPDNVPEGRVPATQYIFVREEDRKTVGMLQMRKRSVWKNTGSIFPCDDFDLTSCSKY